jgi:hypothetical protein
MAKLKLDIEAIRVDSFAVVEGDAEAGTVNGFARSAGASCDAPTCRITECDVSQCIASCPATCRISCNTGC